MEERLRVWKKAHKVEEKVNGEIPDTFETKGGPLGTVPNDLFPDLTV